MKKYESGRSMVEIIGVLAVIGVLSIGGVMGYSYGMDKWRANEIINDVNMRMIDVAQQVFRNQSEIAIPEDWDIKGRSGYVIDVFQNTGSEPSIMVEKVPTRVCKMILQNSADTQDIYVGVLNGDQVDGNWYMGDNEDICDGGDKEILFALDTSILNNLNPDTALECQSNADCRPDKPFCEGGKCVECITDSDCNSRNKYCTSNMCEKCPDDTPFWNASIKKCVGCVTDEDCTGENELCLDAGDSCHFSSYRVCKNYEIHDKKTINGKEWIQIYVNNKGSVTWWDAYKICTHLGKKLPTISEFNEGWNGFVDYDTTCVNSGDCGYNRTKLAKDVYSAFGFKSEQVWFYDNTGACSAFRDYVAIEGYIGSYGRYYHSSALCHD